MVVSWRLVRDDIALDRSITWTCLLVKATCLFSSFSFLLLQVACSPTDQLDEMVTFCLIRSRVHWREDLQGDFQYPPLT